MTFVCSLLPSPKPPQQNAEPWPNVPERRTQIMHAFSRRCLFNRSRCIYLVCVFACSNVVGRRRRRRLRRQWCNGSGTTTGRGYALAYAGYKSNDFLIYLHIQLNGLLVFVRQRAASEPPFARRDR